MKDTISRQNTIDALREKFKRVPTNAIRATQVVENLPPEPRWIPLSEKLPEEETYVLISKKPSPLSGKKWCVTIAGRFIDGRSGKVEWRDIGFGRIYDNDILAWMPLPEPYKEVIR